MNRPGCCGGIATHPSLSDAKRLLCGTHVRPQSAYGQRAGTVAYRICYRSGVGEWDIYLTSEVAAWLESLLENLQATDAKSAGLADDAIYVISRSGPALGRPLVDTITGSKIKNLKELRPGSSGTSEIRILFVFDPWRSAILLVVGDKSGKWNRWYAEAIPHA